MNDLKTAFSPCNEKKTREESSPYASISERAVSFSKHSLFSTPGHKGKLNALDVTEYDEEELFPGSQVELAEKRAAEHYGVKKLRFSVGGSSLAIKAAIVAVDGDVIAPFSTHRCLFEGLKLIGKRAFTFDAGEEDGLPRVPTADDYERAIAAHKEAKAVYVTSPDYFGRTADVESIKKLCEKNGLLLIADCAHGAHFASRPDLFPRGGEKLADFACLSAHKTLRAYTQSAFGVCNNEEYFDRYDEAFTLLGTSSPSYLLLSGLENAIEFERNNKANYAALVGAVGNVKKRVPHLDNDDPLRLVVKAADGKRAYDALVKRGIMPETYYGRYVIFIITLSDGKAKLKKLEKALTRLSKEEKLWENS